MAGDINYRMTMLSSSDELGAPPSPDRFRVSSVSIVCYFVHHIDPTAMRRAIETGTIRSLVDDRSYSTKLRPGSELFHSTLIDAGAPPESLARLVRSPHVDPLQQSLLWLGGEYLLSTLPLVFSVPHADDGLKTIQLAAPLDMAELLNLLGLLSSYREAENLAAVVHASIIRAGILTQGEIAESWPLTGRFGVQLWDLDGTTGRDRATLYRGVAESREYAWEISALLSHGADHLRESGLWLRRSPQQVFSQVHSGFAFFDDHMVFTNADCCLEMAHLPAWLRGRSLFRLAHYGYDSSSIFVWNVAMLRWAVLEHMQGRYRKQIFDLASRVGLTARERSRYIGTQFDHLQLLDRLTSFPDSLVEARNRALDAHIALEHSVDRRLSTLRGDVEKAGALVEGLLRVHEDLEQERRSQLLATLGVGLAVVQIPPFVGQLQIWVANRQWWPLSVSLVAIACALALLPYVWRHHG
jgi:hypothetical protein